MQWTGSWAFSIREKTAAQSDNLYYYHQNSVPLFFFKIEHRVIKYNTQLGARIGFLLEIAEELHRKDDDNRRSPAGLN